MPRGSRFKKPIDGSVFGRAIENAIEDASKLLNAIDFIESPQGLGIRLYPLQRLTVKCIFSVPLDYKPVTIPMWDVFREKLVREVSEEECLHILHEEGRCNVGRWEDIPERGFTEAVIFAGRRGGKAISVDEPIPTPTGFIRNGDLKTGDSVLSPSGYPVKVLIAHESFASKTYRVTFDDGTSVITHPEHLWMTINKSERRKFIRRPSTVEVVPGQCNCGCGKKTFVYKGTPRRFIHGHSKLEPVEARVRTTEEIKNTLQENHTVQLTQAVELPERNLLLDPYCLGVWLGDGNSDCGIITATDEDGVEILSHFTAAGYRWRKSDKGNYRWHVYGLPLTRLGILKNKHIPEEYLWASSAQRLALLQGLMDTDGCCCRSRCDFTNTNRTLAEGVYHLAASLGLKPYWGEGRATLNGKDRGEKYRVTWTGLLPVFRLKRKLDLLPKGVKATQNRRCIISVEPDEEREVRCITVDDPSGLFLFGKNFNVTHNSQVVSAIGAYTLYKLLNIRSPQDYFGLVPGSPVDFTFMAQDDSGASRLYEKLREDINRAPFFNPYLKTSSSASLGFVSDQDRMKRDTTPTINVRSFPCTTNASRGPSNIFLALDEFAHFRSAKGSASDEVYAAATPSTVNFKHAELLPSLGGGWVSQKALESLPYDQYRMFQDSLVLSISSPWTKVGKMYDLHKQALEKGPDSGIFTIRVSTAEMNPTILPTTLRREYEKNPLVFKAEYGGQFLESSETYVTEAQIRSCTDVQYDKNPNTGLEEPDLATARFNICRFHPSAIGRQYFWAIDLGMSNDATAVAIGHLEYKGGTQPIHLIYDYIDRMMVGERFDGPGVQSIPGIEKYVGFKALPLEDILSWLKALNELMPCYRGATDQHGGQQLVQLLDLNKIHNIELVNLTTTINSQMAYVLQGYIRDGRCRFPYTPKFLHELRMVEAEFINKYQIRVQAPLEKGSHDDMVDAAQLCAYKAQKWLIEEGGLKIDPSGQSLLISEQLNHPAGTITGLDGVMLRDLQILERMKKIQQNMASSGGDVVRNPFHRRGR